MATRDGRGRTRQDRYVALPAIKYERPAASALSEFAPENRFYANQRRVEVDQINMGLAKLEWWRLCPHATTWRTSSCMQTRMLPARDAASRCGPTCRRSATCCGSSRHSPTATIRECGSTTAPTTASRGSTCASCSPTSSPAISVRPGSSRRRICRSASSSSPAPTFRDVNFGELTKPGGLSSRSPTASALGPGSSCAVTAVRCRRRRVARAANEHAQQHAFDCEKRESDDPANIIDCLYLYREFSSEAMRILVPYTRIGVDDEVIQSFMAALQLGLKRRFGGRVDHLRMVTQDEPGKDGGPRRHFVMLYDSVPGGTGYLHQLLSAGRETLGEVLRLAHDALTSCSCNQDPEKDGCYRCLYQYRLGRAMELVSRDRARALLGELLESLDQLERVPTISDIFINPNFDSALEARFIESLRRLGGAGRSAAGQVGAGDRRRKVGVSAGSGSANAIGSSRRLTWARPRASRSLAGPTS